ncbi:gp436 family protein [Cognaticolwellia mytili]|uniref:gp436 family protein n=1 Tax=Cognaticolwellia mytili TaxID=1888913 RepID=UPI000A16CD1B|nr:DUF1320 domain-containing protein [Cognaticolwellia mytili]
MYCHKQALINQFGQQDLIDLTDRNSMGQINDEVLERAIKDASAEMDGYIGSRYQLPLSHVPEILLSIACDITIYRLYVNSPSDSVVTRYNNQIKFLKSVAKGEVTLGISTEGTQATSTDFAEVQSAGSVFSRNNSSSFI